MGCGAPLGIETNEYDWKMKQDHLRMNVAPDRTIILGLQIVLDHRSLSSIGRKILMILPGPVKNGIIWVLSAWKHVDNIFLWKVPKFKRVFILEHENDLYPGLRPEMEDIYS